MSSEHSLYFLLLIAPTGLFPLHETSSCHHQGKFAGSKDRMMKVTLDAELFPVRKTLLRMHIWRTNSQALVIVPALHMAVYIDTHTHSPPPHTRVKSPSGAQMAFLVTRAPKRQTMARCQGDSKAPNSSRCPLLSHTLE